MFCCWSKYRDVLYGEMLFPIWSSIEDISKQMVLVKPCQLVKRFPHVSRLRGRDLEMAFKQSLFMLKQKQKNIFYRNSLNETEHTFINQNSGLCGDVQGLPWVEWDFTEQELCSNSPDFARFWKIQGWFSPYICHGVEEWVTLGPCYTLQNMSCVEYS